MDSFIQTGTQTDLDLLSELHLKIQALQGARDQVSMALPLSSEVVA